MNLGKKIKTLRQKNNLTCTDLANILGVTKQAVSLWENDNRLPPITTICFLSEIFDISVDYLLNRTCYEKPDCIILELIEFLEKQNAETQNMIEKLKSIH